MQKFPCTTLRLKEKTCPISYNSSCIKTRNEIIKTISPKREKKKNRLAPGGINIREGSRILRKILPLYLNRMKRKE